MDTLTAEHAKQTAEQDKAVREHPSIVLVAGKNTFELAQLHHNDEVKITYTIDYKLVKCSGNECSNDLLVIKPLKSADLIQIG